MLTRSQSLDLQLDFDPEIERTLRRLRTEARRTNMAGEEGRNYGQPFVAADTRTLLDYMVPPNQTVQNAICFPTIERNNFEMIHPSPTACSLCGSISHKEDTCLVGAYFASPQEDVNYLWNTYNPGWRNHPNFSWGGRQYGNQFSGEQNDVYKPPHAQNQGGYRPERREPAHTEHLEARAAKIE